jgi:hypothetical protein
VRTIDVQPVVDVEDMHGPRAVVNPINDPICAATGAVAARKRAEERFANAVRIDGECARAELEHGGCHGLRQALHEGAPGTGLES